MNLTKTMHLALLVAAFGAMLSFTIGYCSAQCDSLSPANNVIGFLIQLGVLGYAVFAVSLLAHVLKTRLARNERLGKMSRP
jgi:hypothetical protein